MRNHSTQATLPQRAALFDLDETLIDRRGTLEGYARTLLVDFRSRIALDETAFIAVFHACDDLGLTPKAQFFETFAERAFESMSVDELTTHYRANAWAQPRLFAGVPELLRTLRLEGFRIGVVTNGSVETQTAKLVNSGLTKLVDATVISAAVGLRKPDARIFERALEELGVTARRSFFAGDNPQADVVGAHEAGIRSVWIERHFQWPEGLSRCYEISVKQTALLLPWCRQVLG